MTETIRIVCLSGSLRLTSSNSALLNAAAQVAGANFSVDVFDGIGDLPLYSPDLEGTEFEAVNRFRRALGLSDAVLIACPEYAHGIPGAFKNALDWVVGSGEMMEKPTAILRASSRGMFVDANLRETLTAMDAIIVSDACLVVGLNSNRLTSADALADEHIRQVLSECLDALGADVRKRRGLGLDDQP